MTFELDELVIEVVALAGALPHPREHGIAAVGLGDVVDQFLDQHGLADASAAEETDLAALGVWRQQVHHLDAGDENLGLGRLIDIGGRRLMDRAASLHLDRPGLVNGFADHVHDAPERALADRHRDRLAGVSDLLAAHQALGNVHGDAAHGVLAELLGDFEHELVAVVVGHQRVENRRQVAVELDVDDGADHLGDAAGGVGDVGHGLWSS